MWRAQLYRACALPGRVEFYAFNGATAAQKRLTTAPTAAEVLLQKFEFRQCSNFGTMEKERERVAMLFENT